MPDAAYSPGFGPLVALVLVIAVSGWLGLQAERAISRGSFLRGYFLGNRGLGAWALALTATVQSGGTFMGFPSLIYSHGWIVALWIASYMVVPLTGFGILGKRLAQLSRRTGAITMPDLLRERFADPTVGLWASLLVMFFMLFMMVAQFKAGAIVMKIAWPGTGALALSEDIDTPGDSTNTTQNPGEQSSATDASADSTPAGAVNSPKDIASQARSKKSSIDVAYLVGLAIFAMTVVGYTLMGGFLASVWTDLFQSLLMLVGVVLLFALTVPAAGGIEQGTRVAIQHTGPGYVFGPGYAQDGRQFLPLGLAISFFFVWIFGGLGSPPGMVRIMACKNTATIRRSMFLLCIYNSMIYLPLVAICVCGRALIPGLGDKSDEIIPRLALSTTQHLPGGSLLAGLILAAPFGAVMATVSTYLVVFASAMVRDVYQRFLNPEATSGELRRVTYLVMIALGIIGVASNVYPVAYLQALVIFSSVGQAASFVVPALMTAYWRRATATGMLAAMAAGAGTVLCLSILGWASPDPMIGNNTRFRPYFLGGFDPVVWGLLASLVAGVTVSLLTRPPDAALIRQLFDADPDMEPTHDAARAHA